MVTQPDTITILQRLQHHLPALRETYRVRSLWLFGSYARREQQADSDVDVLVTFDETPSLLQFVELEQRLSDILGVRVDLVMRDALRPAIGQQILREIIPV